MSILLRIYVGLGHSQACIVHILPRTPSLSPLHSHLNWKAPRADGFMRLARFEYTPVCVEHSEPTSM